MTTIVGGLRARLIRESLFHKLDTALTSLGWFDPTRPHSPITFVQKKYNQSEPILINSIGLSDESTSDDAEVELGSNLSEDRWTMYVDFFAESDAIGLHLIRDVRDVLLGKMPSISCGDPSFDVFNYTQATPSIIFRCQIENIMIDRPDTFLHPWLEHWYACQFVVVDQYLDEVA